VLDRSGPPPAAREYTPPGIAARFAPSPPVTPEAADPNDRGPPFVAKDRRIEPMHERSVAIDDRSVGSPTRRRSVRRVGSMAVGLAVVASLLSGCLLVPIPVGGGHDRHRHHHRYGYDR
jgi:hypothetical protein